MASYGIYRKELVRRFWSYSHSALDQKGLLEREFAPDGRPPVFEKTEANKNVLVDEQLSQQHQQEVLDYIPRNQRHRWFRSMTSSQALAQSVFGNLKVLGKLDLLADLTGDNGRQLFLPSDTAPEITLEHDCDHLNEPRKTSVDVFIASGSYNIAVECKLSEPEVGTCSRPRLKPKDSNYERDHCDGHYGVQHGRTQRCSLTEIGVSYWQHIPELFEWRADIDYESCPLRFTYQLVRNVLAACVESDGITSADRGHAVLLYDERNPAFHSGGKGMNAWEEVKGALKSPELLQKCTWQQVVDAMRQDSDTEQLTKTLEQKYGF